MSVLTASDLDGVDVLQKTLASFITELDIHTWPREIGKLRKESGNPEGMVSPTTDSC